LFPELGIDILKKITTTHLGLTKFAPTWSLQKQLFVLREEKKTGDVLLFTEHLPVYTFGKSGEADHLLANEAELLAGGVDVFNIDRGGDVTFHGPGQLVGYPILDLNDYYLDLHRYLRDIEEVLIRTLADFDIAGTREPEFTGVWVNGSKIAAIGVKASRWITMHGFALNVNTDLKYFERIIPCGIFHKGVTSMKQELGREISLAGVQEKAAAHFGEVFGAEMTESLLPAAEISG
jgi:lipoyl(octanoyl) transferase